MVQGRGEKVKLLIVDDEPLVRELLCELLSEEYACTEAESGEAALALISRHDFKVVISDITMRGISGLELLPLIRRDSPDAVVVMISGADMIDSAIGAMRAGAYDFLRKPFDLSHVELAVRRAVEHHDLIVARRRHDEELERLVAERTARLKEAIGALDDAYRVTLCALSSALDTRDTETSGHSERVVSFSLRLGRELGLTPDGLRSLEYGALLHDVGKIGVPDAILHKPGQLTEEEWVQMRCHPLHGCEILRGITFLEGAARVVAQHHEKWDGSGYPLGLAGREIDLNARIFMVVDAYDAMTSDRVYRLGRPHAAACEELLRCSGSHFDPEIVRAFVSLPEHVWEELRRLPPAPRPTPSVRELETYAGAHTLLPVRERVGAAQIIC